MIKRWWLVGLLLALVPAPARAVDPIWGDIPNALGLGTIHPIYQSRYFDAGSTRRGGVRMRMFEQELKLEYAPSTAVNLRLDIPYLNNLHEGHSGGHGGTSGGGGGGHGHLTAGDVDDALPEGFPDLDRGLSRSRGGRRSAFVSGLGDITVRASRRVSVQRREGFLGQQALFFGVKLPTGATDEEIGGARLDPGNQAGTGKLGVLLGYAWSEETLPRMLWASATWKRDVGGGFRQGDSLEVAGTWAPWIKRPNVAEELGFKIATGAYGQYHAADTQDGGRSARNSYGVLGLHVTPVVTRGNYIFQAGVFVPLVRGGSQDHSDYPFQVRVGLETFF